jgi:hypothetical protein
MTNKIKVVPGFPTVKQIANELRVSEAELTAIDNLLAKPVVRTEPNSKKVSGSVARKSAAMKRYRAASRRPARKSILQAVKAAKKRSAITHSAGS